MILVLDLDDTLYEEQSFVLSGFQHVAEWLSKQSLSSEKLLLDSLIQELADNGRGKVFDAILKDLKIFSSENLSECIRIYRGHSPLITLFPGADEVLKRYSTVPLYLVTDGDPSVQNSKIDALNIRNRFRKIYTTGSLGEEWKKPSLRAFSEIAELEGANLSELVYVGDDPNKDFVQLNSVGAQTIRVMTGRFRALRMPPDFEAQHQIASIADLQI